MFLKGIEEKYPKELLENRPIIEGQVVGVLWKQPDLYDDFDSLNAEAFITEDGQFYYAIGKEMYRRGYELFDEQTVLAFLTNNKILLEGFEKRGGYANIQEVIDIVTLENANTYVDDLFKWNILNNLYIEGFNLFNKIKVEGKEICPFNILKKMSSQQVADWYEWRIENITLNKSLGNIKIVDLTIDDEFINKCNSGEEMGLSYAKIGTDINGKTIWGSPILSNSTMGIHKGDVEVIGASSGKGKSSYVLAERVFPIIENGEKVCVMANEMNIDKYKKILLSMILAYKFNYFKITRRNLTKGNFDDKLDQIKKAQKYFNEHYKGLIKFVKLTDYGMNTAKRIVKKLSKEGVGYFIYDTFKAESMADENVRGKLIENSKIFFRLAEKYNVEVTIVMQLAIYMDNTRFLTSACLSEAKGIKEIVSEILLFRELWDDEYDGGKFDVKPYRFVKDENGKYTNTKEYITLDKNKKYRLMFVDKTRNDDDGKVVLYEFNGAWNLWREIGFATVSHINRGGNK